MAFEGRARRAEACNNGATPAAGEDLARVRLTGAAPSFLAALHVLRKLSASDATVLIRGETGTGKELAARAIHYLGARRNAPFIPVNCGAIPDTLIESEFFGHARGAFTDAKESRAGLIEQAEGGTLFLDELEVLSPRAQVALLRFLQDSIYRPIGGPLGREANVRIIGSTNADLRAMADVGVYRTDLLFRLSVLVLDLPPLRHRPGDATLLAETLLTRFCERYSLPAKPFDAAARHYLESHDWPGNVRELENLVHRALLLSEGAEISFTGIVDSVTASDPGANGKAPAQSRTEPGSGATLESKPEPEPIEPFHHARARAIEEFERAYVTAVLRRTRGNMSLAARLCGKERSRFAKLAKKYGLERVAFASPAVDPKSSR